MARPLINITLRQALWFALFLVLYEFLTYIANDMIMPGMLKVVHSFNGPESAVADSLTAYVLGGASLQLFLGPISDRYGRRPVMLFGASFFFLCTILIAVSNSMEQFIAARFLQGMGLCFIGVIGYATLQEIFAEMDAIRLISLMANVSISAPLIGPLLGAVFIYYFNWRLIFVGIGSIALVALWGLWRFMPEPVGQTKRTGELIPRVSLAPRVVASNYKKLCMNLRFSLGSISLGFLGIPCLIWIALSPIILINDAHLTVIQYGLWQMPVFAASIMGNWFLRYLTHRYQVADILQIGSCIVGFGLLLSFILPFFTQGHYLGLMPGLIIYFFGLGVANAPLDRLILFSTQVVKGTASALMTMIAMCVHALGIEIANIMYASHHSNISYGAYGAAAGALYFIGIYSSLLRKKKA
jgi:DHA1 family multidrug/chloramphenicol efflux transport protein-like MFS transporter